MNKTTIAILTSISIIALIPSVYALSLNTTFDEFCDKKLNNKRLTAADIICSPDLLFLYEVEKPQNMFTFHVIFEEHELTEETIYAILRCPDNEVLVSGGFSEGKSNKPVEIFHMEHQGSQSMKFGINNPTDTPYWVKLNVLCMGMQDTNTRD